MYSVLGYHGEEYIYDVKPYRCAYVHMCVRMCVCLSQKYVKKIKVKESKRALIKDLFPLSTTMAASNVPGQCLVSNGASEKCQSQVAVYYSTFGSGLQPQSCTNSDVQLIHATFDACNASSACKTFLQSQCQQITHCPLSMCTTTPSGSSVSALTWVLFVLVLLAGGYLFYNYRKSNVEQRKGKEESKLI